MSCKFCQRSFSPDRLTIHLRNCPVATQSHAGFRATVCEPGAVPTVAAKWASLTNEELSPTAFESPALKQCTRCKRMFSEDRISAHQGRCRSTENPSHTSSETLSASSLEAEVSDQEREVPIRELITCRTCSRKFEAGRIVRHQEICALGLASFRATVEALELNEQEISRHRLLEEALKNAKEAAEIREGELLQQLADAEARALDLQRKLEVMEHRFEVAQAASKSMEAAHDVVVEAMEDERRAHERAMTECSERELSLKARSEEAERLLEVAQRRAERAEAAAKSMEATADVALEEVRDLQLKLEQVQSPGSN